MKHPHLSLLAPMLLLGIAGYYPAFIPGSGLYQTPQQNSDAKKFSKKGNIEMVQIPAGEFTMGGTANNEGRMQHKIFLDAFQIGKTPVTVAQFKAYCKDKDIDFFTFDAPEWGWIDNHPMVNVTWEDARNFCKWAGGDLPTEAQWEKAARGTDGREYPWVMIGMGADSSGLQMVKHSVQSRQLQLMHI